MTKKAHLPRPALRHGEQVSPLELFFDLVFVLALTQCTALMSEDPTWTGLAQGLLVLGLIWWSWVGYSWLTSVADPEDDLVRIAIFAGMAGLLVVGLCVPAAFGDRALAFALAYATVRISHDWFFLIVSRTDRNLERSIRQYVASTAVAVALLVVGALLGGTAQGVLWALALALDMGGPYIVGSTGWRLVPRHFAERHGLILIIALGESIVAIGVGVGATVTFGQGVAAVLGIALAAAMWWLYFDVVALVAARRLERAEVGRVQNEMARDSYSYLHFLMIAGIILVALGLKKTLEHVDDPLKVVPAFALLGGMGLYLLGHVAFRYRHIHTVNRQRTVLAIGLVAAVPLATQVTSTTAVASLVVLTWLLIVYETRSYGGARQQVRGGDLTPMHEAR